MKQFYASVALAGLLVTAGCHKDESDNTMAPTDNGYATADNMAMNNGAAAMTVDAAFLTDAMKGDNSEVAIGKLAAAQGGSQAVKDLGTMLVTDHGAHKDKLAAMASGAGIATTDDTSDDGKAALAKLTPLHGDAFDKAFKETAIADHEKDIAKYEKQAAATDAQTAALAKDTLPTLHKHLDAAKKL